jgi:hypothetical protein
MKHFAIPVLALFALALAACGGAPPQPTTSANVRLHSQLDSDSSQYRVEGAAGADEIAAKKSATIQALVHAAKEMAGDPQQKNNAGDYVKGHLLDVMPMATHGKIFKRGFSPDGESATLSLMIKINVTELKRHLLENEVITGSRALAKSVGRPNIMVVFDQGDCTRGNTSGPLCELPKRIKAQAGKVETAKQDVNTFQKQVIDAGCMIATQVTVDAETETTDKSKSSASFSDTSSANSASRSNRKNDSSASRRAAGVKTQHGAAGSQRASASSSSSASSASASNRQNNVKSNQETQLDRSSKSKFSSKAIKASDNCRTFMTRFGPLEARLWKEQAKLDKIQDKLDTARAGVVSNDVTSDKVGEWFTKNQWDIVSREGVTQAQRTQDAMINVEGLGQDPIAALAQLAGADIYVMHGLTESSAGGGYQVEVNLKAYEVASGKQLATKVGKSNQLASAQKGNATSQAVGRAMPKILEQIQGYWSIMAKEGVKAKVVFRGDFSSSKVKRRLRKFMKGLNEYIDECDDTCEWEKGLSTGQTISGQYTMPPKARSDFGDYLTEALEEEGFTVQQIISNKTLNIIQIIN